MSDIVKIDAFTSLSASARINLMARTLERLCPNQNDLADALFPDPVVDSDEGAGSDGESDANEPQESEA